MRFLKRVIQWTIGIICGLYLSLQIVMRIPIVQQWAGTLASSALKELWNWDISIGRIRFGLLNRVIIDDVYLKDQNDSTMLHASRLAAKINILPFLDGKVSIANIQLFGTQANLYQSSPEEKPNFQFILDTFSSTDTTSTPLDLHIGSVLLRRVEVRWDKQWMPRKDSGVVDLNHLHVKDIAVTARIRTLQEDSLNIAIKRLSFNESNGFALKKLSFDVNVGKNSGELSDFLLLFPKSSLDIPTIRASWQSFPKNGDWSTWLQELTMYGDVSLRLTPSDFKSFVPNLYNADEPVRLSTQFYVSDTCLNVPRLSVENNGSFKLESGIFAKGISHDPIWMVDIRNLTSTSNIQQFITKTIYGKESEISPVLTRLDTVSIKGRMQFFSKEQQATLRVRNRSGNIDISANAKEWNRCDIDIKSDGININKLLSNNGIHPLDKVVLEVNMLGEIRDAKGKPNISVYTSLPQIFIQNREYNDVILQCRHKDGISTLEASVEDQGGVLNALLNLATETKQHVYGNIELKNFNTDRLGLGERYPNTLLSLNTSVDVSMNNIDDLTGSLNIDDFIMETSEQDSIIVGPLHLSVVTDMDKKGWRTVDVASEPFNLSAKGKFKFTTLATTITNALHKKLPNVIPYKHVSSKADEIQFVADFQDTVLLKRVALQNISLPERINVAGRISQGDSLSLNTSIPELHIGKEFLRNSYVSINGTPESIVAKVKTDRLQKAGFVSTSLQAKAADNRLRLTIGLDNNRKPHFGGEMDVTANFMKTNDGKHDIRVWIAPSDIVIADTTWRIHPSRIHWDSSVASVYGFKVSQSNVRGIEINGKLSANESDTLKVNLQKVNVGYILDLVNFHSVEFGGLASGTAIATGLLANPNAWVDLMVDNFTFNYAPLGTLNARAKWGETPNFLSLDADIYDPNAFHHTHIDGGFNIGSKSVPDGLDLRINTKNFNLAFINFFTKDIFDNFQGRTSGYCRVFGPFSGIDLEGDMQIEHADFGMSMLGTAYHLQKDSVHLRPGSINIDAVVMDKHARPYEQYARTGGKLQHTALLDGKITFNHFKNLKYDFNVQANKFLGYDFKEFGESSFHATCYATGTIGVRGESGILTVDINAMPEAGTSFTYNVSTPEALTEAGFITFTDNSSACVQSLSKELANRIEEPEPTSDLYINFNLQMTPQAKVKLLMDRKSGDMIQIEGSGRLMAKYHNKSRFNLFGTYHIQDGTYRFSLQDIIRKEFRFQPDGIITFSGDPLKADLALKATYSVHGVSLDDLTSSSLGFAKTQVDCIMNLSGRPEHPVVTFDFDLPNVTEDERQMIRSIVRTEEERNMQAIYLLGLGRFYNFDATGIAQGTTAMNSLLSSTLSTQLNQFLSNATGSTKWNIGTSIKTGEVGWSNLDVEGVLSGKLFDDRLLLSGNFGYREKYYTQRNFVTDVTVEYLLTKNGSISLKAYNQSNDRYFVQSSLNTQGIGIQIRTDFNRFSDLFLWLKPKKD